MIDRRQKRSDSFGPALEYWLDAAARRAGVEGLVLADDHGLVVASTVPRERAEAVAANAPLALRSVDPAGAPVTVKPMAVGEIPMFLCAVGGRNRHWGLSHAEPGVTRIVAAI
jgi:hypothetical protein